MGDYIPSSLKQINGILLVNLHTTLVCIGCSLGIALCCAKLRSHLVKLLYKMVNQDGNIGIRNDSEISDKFEDPVYSTGGHHYLVVERASD